MVIKGSYICRSIDASQLKILYLSSLSKAFTCWHGKYPSARCKHNNIQTATPFHKEFNQGVDSPHYQRWHLFACRMQCSKVLKKVYSTLMPYSVALFLVFYLEGSAKSKVFSVQVDPFPLLSCTKITLYLHILIWQCIYHMIMWILS